MPAIWTIGHSTRTFEDFVALLQRHGIESIADVRAFPGSRRHPQFNREALSEALVRTGIVYDHFPALGGRRRPRPGAAATGWRVAGFQAYADYMTTEDFDRALLALRAVADGSRCAVMCAEAVPWRCHRTLVADALTAAGYRVLHILSADDPNEHSLTSFARVREGKVSYPPEAEAEEEGDRRRTGSRSAPDPSGGAGADAQAELFA